MRSLRLRTSSRNEAINQRFSSQLNLVSKLGEFSSPFSRMLLKPRHATVR